ncbi:cbb3-type cytochrome c oxidase subunit 3 [Sulfitobacter sp. HNIBRBA2951]|uniref:cbb3-type cytochrome c oxidase subunit 3 n=1 Tax=Sulfitobacter aquimarinus TaxID=3158557 RepID=UPI0032DF6D68
METYSLLRQFADSWVLLAMFVFFICAGIWAFLPSQSNARTQASMIPLRDDKPVADPANAKGPTDV